MVFHFCQIAATKSEHVCIVPCETGQQLLPGVLSLWSCLIAYATICDVMAKSCSQSTPGYTQALISRSEDIPPPFFFPALCFGHFVECIGPIQKDMGWDPAPSQWATLLNATSTPTVCHDKLLLNSGHLRRSLEERPHWLAGVSVETSLKRSCILLALPLEAGTG